MPRKSVPACKIYIRNLPLYKNDLFICCYCCPVFTGDFAGDHVCMAVSQKFGTSGETESERGNFCVMIPFSFRVSRFFTQATIGGFPIKHPFPPPSFFFEGGEISKLLIHRLSCVPVRLLFRPESVVGVPGNSFAIFLSLVPVLCLSSFFFFKIWPYNTVFY